MRWLGVVLVPFVAVAACGNPYDSESTPAPPDAGDAGAPDDALGTKCEANTCKVHESCADGPAGPTCTCVKGYVAENGTCVFRGGPLDPGFVKTPDVWVTTGLAAVEPTSSEPMTLPGQIDPGWARLRGTGRVSQSFDMPEWQLAEPLAMETSAGCLSDCDNLEDRAMMVRIGGRGYVASLTSPLAKTKTCLGERAYGGTITLDIRAVSSDGPGGNNKDEPKHHGYVDLVRFYPAPECPLPGQIPNGNFDANGGWVGGGTGVAEVANAVGTNGSRAAHLRAANGEGPVLTGLASVPHKTITHPALVFNYRVQSGRTAQIRLGGTIVGIFGGTGGFEDGRMCLPEWSKGRVVTLGIATSNPTPLGEPTELLVDDLRVVDDPACGDPAFVRDGGFEGNVRSRPWGLQQNGAATNFVVDASSAHGGTTAFVATIPACNTSGGISQSVTVPPPSATGGPAAKFWYKANLPAVTSASGGTAALAPAAQWAQKVACLPPHLEGLEYDLRFTITAGANCAGGGMLAIDDVEITTDASCPKE